MVLNVAKKLPFQVFPFRPSAHAKIHGAAIIVSYTLSWVLYLVRFTKTRTALSSTQVLQEWWGVNDQIKRHAQRIADSTGAYTVVPDLYKGKLGLSAEVWWARCILDIVAKEPNQEASHLMGNLDWKQAVHELEELAEQLREAKYPQVSHKLMDFSLVFSLTYLLQSNRVHWILYGWWT